MKRLFVFVILIMLFTASALADDGIFLREIPQDPFSLATVIAPESYPEICITSFSKSDYVYGKASGRPLFLHIPFPENTLASTFQTDYVHALNTTQAVQYDYSLTEIDSWKTFLKKARSSKYVICQGEDGVAAYVEPNYNEGYAIIEMKSHFGSKAKLQISVCLDYLGHDRPEDEVISAVTDALLAEVSRVKEQMRFERADTFWNKNIYSGFKMLNEYDSSNKYLIRFVFPEMTLITKDGNEQKGDNIVVESRDNWIDFIYDFGEKRCVLVRAEITEDPVPETKLKDKSPDALKITAENGTEWAVYAFDISSSGSTGLMYFSKALKQVNNKGKHYYLQFRFEKSLYMPYWSGKDTVLEYLNLFAKCFEEVEASEDPYVPGETTNPEPAESEAAESASEKTAPAAENNTWTCSNCGRVNDSKFCPDCGAADNSTWTCLNCGRVNDSKFCPDCGAVKP